MHSGIYDHTVALRISTADRSESAAQSADVSVVLVTEAVCGSGRCSAGEYQCAVGSSCITAAQLCDGVRHCSDGSDEDWHAGCAISSAAGLSHFSFLLWPTRVADVDIVVLSCGFFILSFFLFSSANVSGHRLDVYHTLTHGVALL